MSMELYHSGRLSEAISALVMPTMAAESQANAVYRCAKEAGTAWSRDAVIAEAERLERAAATLRKAAELGKPALRLVAAE